MISVRRLLQSPSVLHLHHHHHHHRYETLSVTFRLNCSDWWELRLYNVWQAVTFIWWIYSAVYLTIDEFKNHFNSFMFFSWTFEPFCLFQRFIKLFLISDEPSASSTPLKTSSWGLTSKNKNLHTRDFRNQSTKHNKFSLSSRDDEKDQKQFDMKLESQTAADVSSCCTRVIIQWWRVAQLISASFLSCDSSSVRFWTRRFHQVSRKFYVQKNWWKPEML